VRKVVTQRFGYLINYTIDESTDEIVILSVKHPPRNVSIRTHERRAKEARFVAPIAAGRDENVRVPPIATAPGMHPKHEPIVAGIETNRRR
jgi:hypothetical protein